MLNEKTIERVTGALRNSGGLQYTESLVQNLPEEQYIDFIQQIDEMVLLECSITQNLIDRIFAVVNQTTYFNLDEDAIRNLLAD